MAYARRSNAARGTSRRAPRFRRRRMSVATAKVRYQPPTARKQKSQILANRRDIERLKAQTRKIWIWTDYQLRIPVEDQPLTVNTWKVFRLLDFALWTPVLREDLNVRQSSHTFIKRMQMNMRLRLNDALGAYFNVFIVTPRKIVGNRDFALEAPLPVSDFIYDPTVLGSMIRLNPAVFKVHYAAYRTFTENGLGTVPAPGQNAGNPNTTWCKMQINKDVNIPVTIPTVTNIPAPQQNWLQKKVDDMPYWANYQLLIYANWAMPGAGPVLSIPSVQFDTLFTNINS